MTNGEDPENSFEVGYRKPPKEGRFEKGKSGNPKGRPKGAKNLATIVEQVGRQPVRINGPNGTRTITKNHAVILQLGIQAAQGDLAAIRFYVSLLQGLEQRAQDGQPIVPLHEIDQVVMHNFVQRIKKLKTAPSSSDSDDAENKEPE